MADKEEDGDGARFMESRSRYVLSRIRL